MKILKSFLPIAICLCCTIAVDAQNANTVPAKDVKKEVDKTTEAKQTPPPATVMASSPTQESKPQPGTAEPKINLMTSDPAAANKTLTPEQQAILNGKKERPKEKTATPNTSQPDASMQPLPKPAGQ